MRLKINSNCIIPLFGKYGGNCHTLPVGVYTDNHLEDDFSVFVEI